MAKDEKDPEQPSAPPKPRTTSPDNPAPVAAAPAKPAVPAYVIDAVRSALHGQVQRHHIARITMEGAGLFSDETCAAIATAVREAKPAA
jgi:hypothetical protein